jgi:lysophospholipase L1-like esterase
MKPPILLSAALGVVAASLLHSQAGPTPFPENEADWPGRGPVRTFPYMNDNRNSFRQNRERDQGGVVLVGDSLVAGAKNWEPLQKAFPHLLIVDRGIGGDTSRGALFRFQEDVLDLNPKAVVMLVGSNDLSAHGKPDDTVSNLSEMVAMAGNQNPGLPIIICTIPPRDHPKAPTQPGKLEELNEKIKALGQGRTVILDIHPMFLKEDGTQDPRYFAEDLLHLSPAAYEKVSEELKDVFVELNIK